MEVELDLVQIERERLERLYGKGNVFNTKEVTEKFEIYGFIAPYCRAKEKATGDVGFLTFVHFPRFYYDWRVSSKPKEGDN